MRIAVMSDLHDNVRAWELIAKYLHDEEIVTLLNCGDTCAPAMLADMAKTYHGHIHTVYGNVADREQEMTIAKSLKNVTHYGDSGVIAIAGRKVFINHYPAAAEKKALSGDVHLACHGHTHLKRWEPIGKTLVLNPGTAGGMFQYPSIATVDLKELKCSFVDFTL